MERAKNRQKSSLSAFSIDEGSEKRQGEKFACRYLLPFSEFHFTDVIAFRHKKLSEFYQIFHFQLLWM